MIINKEIRKIIDYLRVLRQFTWFCVKQGDKRGNNTKKGQKQPYFCVVFSFYCKKTGAEDAFSVKIRKKRGAF